jgi:hypothetical protein
MKKELILGAVLTCLAGIPVANASEFIIQPTLITGGVPVVETAVPVIAEPVYYPVHHDHHHHYNWRYWDERHEHWEHDRR